MDAVETAEAAEEEAEIAEAETVRAMEIQAATADPGIEIPRTEIVPEEPPAHPEEVPSVFL